MTTARAFYHFIMHFIMGHSKAKQKQPVQCSTLHHVDEARWQSGRPVATMPAAPKGADRWCRRRTNHQPQTQEHPTPRHLHASSHLTRKVFAGKRDRSSDRYMTSWMATCSAGEGSNIGNSSSRARRAAAVAQHQRKYSSAPAHSSHRQPQQQQPQQQPRVHCTATSRSTTAA